jgi:hypothetical protein
MNIPDAKRAVLDMAAGFTVNDVHNQRAWVWCALARLVRNTGVEEALQMLDDGLDPAYMSMFTIPGYIRAIIRHRDQLPDDLYERIAVSLTENTSYEGIYDSVHTENHKVMIATTRLLVAQAFPDRRIDGTCASVAYQASLDWLRAWGESRMIYGHAEYHSDIYSMTYTMPLLNLRDCATDPTVSHMAEMMTDYVALHHALSHLDDMYAGGHSRAYDHKLLHTRAHNSQTWSYLFYGSDHIYSPEIVWFQLTAADSDYVPHPAIIHTAKERNTSYSTRERHAEIGSNGVPMDIQRQVWMTDSHALSSLQGYAWPDHQLRWSLKIAGDDPHTIIMTSQTGKSEKSGTWHGASEYEHLLQHEGAIIVSYNIPETDPHPEIYGHLPWNADEWSVEPSTLSDETAPRWVCLRIEGTFTAFYPLAPFKVVDDVYSGFLIDGTSIEGAPYRRFIGASPRHGMVLEAARAKDWPSFQTFVDAVTANTPQITDSWTVRYTALDGTRMELTNPGPQPDAVDYLRDDGTVDTVVSHLQYRSQRPDATFSIDGNTPAFGDWPSLESPFANSGYGSGVYEVKAGGHDLRLDFRKWEKTGNINR